MARKSTLQFYSASNQFNELGAMFVDALIDGTIGTPSKHKLTLTGIEGGKFVIEGDFDISGGVITGGVIEGFTAFVGLGRRRAGPVPCGQGERRAAPRHRRRRIAVGQTGRHARFSASRAMRGRDIMHR